MGFYPQISANKKAGIFAEKSGFKYVIGRLAQNLSGGARDAGKLMALFCIFVSIMRHPWK